MKHRTLKLTMLAALGLTTTQASALGLVALPDTGFSSSAYTNCYNDGRVVPPSTADDVKGNFGSYPIASANLPSISKNNTCFVEKPIAELISPISGYTYAAATTRPIPGDSGTIGQVADYVWRNSAKTMCIFGTRITMVNADHTNGSSIYKYFEVNDIARGGFANSGTVNVGYTLQTNNASPIYRVGRTFTSVQHRPYNYHFIAEKEINGINYLDLPTKNSVTAAISGETNTTPPFSTSLAKQDAVVNSNWIDFTTRVTYADHDTGETLPYSPFFYIEAPCDSSSPYTWVKSGAIRLRQTGQEVTSLKEIVIDGYAPPGATLP